MDTTVKRTWTILRIAILVFLIVGVVDLLLTGGSVFREVVQSDLSIMRLSQPMKYHLRNPPQPYSHYDSLVRDPAITENINYKRLHIDIDPTQVVAAYDVYLKKDHPLFLGADSHWHPQSAQAVSNEILGAVSVVDELLKFERIETSIAETDESGHLYVKATPYRVAFTSYRIIVHAKQRNVALNIASKEVIVHTRGVNVRSDFNHIPVSKTPDETRYILPAHGDQMSFLVEVTEDVAPPETPPQNTLAALLQKNAGIPGLDGLMLGLLEAIPFIVFIVWLRRNATDIPNALSQQRVIETYLVLHFSYFFFYSLDNLIEGWRSPFMLALGYFERQKIPAFGAFNYLNRPYVLVTMMALFIYVWPKFARAWTEPPTQRKPHWLERATPILHVISAIIIFAVLLMSLVLLLAYKWTTIRTDMTALTVAEFYSLFFAVLVLALYILVLLLGRAISLRERLGFALNLFLLLLALIAAEIFYRFAGSNQYLWFANGALRIIVFMVAAMAIVWAFAVLGYRAIADRSLLDDLKGWSAKKQVLLFIALAAVALSNRYWTWPMTYWPLWWLAWALKDLFFLVLIWFLANFLRRASEDYPWLELPALARKAGILLALFMFYTPLTRWNYIPVSFIVGYLLLRFWLLPEKQFDRGVFSDIKSNLKQLIDRVIAFNDAERALHSLKKELLAKLGKGELEPQQYSDKLQAQAEALETHRAHLMVRDHFSKDHVLALGPGDSAWKTGRQTALYSLLFSIPWSFLYLRDLVRAQVTSDSYLLLDLLSNVGYFFLVWLSYGFIFGYFYPHIRGKNGIQKGLAMFLTIVVPELVWTALAQPVNAANWTSYGFWTLQIFVHTMLLGMITGDLATMRAHGFKWRHLLDFYRLSSLSAWASSVILAIAAAAGTLITSGATEILTSAFKYMGVIPPDVELPKR